MEQPKRALHLTLSIGADTRRDLVHALMDLAVDVNKGRLSGEFVTGGSSLGYTGKLEENGDMTNEAYHAALQAYLHPVA